MYLLVSFILQNFKKILRADPELWDVPFSGPKWPLCPDQIFFLVQAIIIILIYLLVFSIVQNLKEFLQRIQSYEDAPFLDPKRSMWPQTNIFWKIINIILTYLLAPFIVQNF